jgi:DNA-binding ferritin-like protein
MLVRQLKSSDNSNTPPTRGEFAQLMGEFLESVTSIHKLHLKITGPGSFAAHLALGDFYDKIGDLADSIVESYQGCTEKILPIPQVDPMKVESVDQALQFLRNMYKKVNEIQATCQHSEINNELDNVKTLINSTKYKLIFLK